MIYWLTGQPGHGKTTLSHLLKRKLEIIYKPVGKEIVQVDGDDLRDLTVNKDYSEQGRINKLDTIRGSKHLYPGEMSFCSTHCISRISSTSQSKLMQKVCL